MGGRLSFQIDPRWSFAKFLDELFAYYRGAGIESTGRRLSAMRSWLSLTGRARAIDAIRELEKEAGDNPDLQVAESLWMSKRSYQDLKRWVNRLPPEDVTIRPVKAFISYKWESGEHVAWVRMLAADLRNHGVEAILDQWEVRLGESFTDYMQGHIANADVVLFVITPEAVKAAEAPQGQGGALKFEVQMMNARRMADGVRVVGVYRSGDRPPNYLRDHRYVDFRSDAQYDVALAALVDDLLGRAGPPPVRNDGEISAGTAGPPAIGGIHTFSRVRLESLLSGNRDRDVEITNGLWEAPAANAVPTQYTSPAPVRIGLFDDETFELRIPRGPVHCLSVPYVLVIAAWLASDGKLAVRLDGRPVLHTTGFRFETD